MNGLQLGPATAPGWTFYVSMVAAGYVVELTFQPLGLVPEGPRQASVGEDSIRWNYTTVLNIVFVALAATLLSRFFRTGGRGHVVLS
jgi:hypothetical protein